MTKYKLFSCPELDEKLPLQKTLRLRAGDLEICLARTENGIFAVSNACTHRKANLHEGWLNAYDEVVCPLHQYRFCLKTGNETSGNGCQDLKTYKVELSAEGLFIWI